LFTHAEFRVQSTSKGVAENHLMSQERVDGGNTRPDDDVDLCNGVGVILKLFENAFGSNTHHFLGASSGNAHLGVEGSHGALSGVLSLSGTAVAGGDSVLGAGGS